MIMTASEYMNHKKQKKNAKRGGYKMKDQDTVNKNRIFKIQRLINELEKEYDEHWDAWKRNAEMHDQGYARAVDHIQRRLIAIMQGK